MKRSLALMVAGGFILSFAFVSVIAQETKSVNDGVYTADQAKKGEAVYKEQCAACHGDNLEGSGPMPPLAGKDFLANWQGKTLGELYEKVQTTMPATAPGTMTPEQTADTVAYMLSKDNYPAGSTALEGKMEPLAKIKLDAPK